MKVLDDDSQLIRAACQGSHTAFEALVVRYEPRIRRMLYGLTHDYHLTQDLCQETFLAAYRALPRMQGAELHFAPWLYRITLNQARSEWRRAKHVTLVPFVLPQGDGEDAYHHEPGENYLKSPLHFEEQVGQREAIQRVLAHLPKASVACLLLDAEGLSYQEIADVLQISLSALRSRLARARQAFQKHYISLEKE